MLFLVPLAGVVGHPVHGQCASGAGAPTSIQADPLAAIADLEATAVSIESALLTASEAGRGLTGNSFDPAAVGRELDRLAEGARSATRGRKQPREAVAALNRFLFEEEGFTYDCAAGNPDYYLVDRVLAGKRGNCLGLTSLYLILAERLSLPIHGVYVPSHCFARYDDGAARFNIETAERGSERDDERYRREFGLRDGRPYPMSLGKKEMAGVFLKSLGAAFSRRGRDEEALRVYRVAAALSPGLPDVSFNAGVSLQKMGMIGEAIGQYRRALELDPGLAAARDNLGVSLAKTGRLAEALVEARKAVALSPRNAVSRGNLAATLCACGKLEEGILEFRKVLETEPGNRRALAGLARAYFDRREFPNALVFSDMALEAGCRLDSSMLEFLDGFRSRAAAAKD